MNQSLNLEKQKILTLIEQGKSDEIAVSLNNYFASQGIRAKVAWKNAYLGILLEALHRPDKETMVKIISQGFDDFASDSVKAIRIYGREIGQVTPAWCEEIAVAKSPPLGSNSISVADWLSQGLQNDSFQSITNSSHKQSELSKFLRFYFSPKDTALLPLKNVKEVLNIPLMGILPVPHMADCLIGIYNYRGEILWLVDLGAQLGFIPSTEFIKGISYPEELSIKTTANLTANKGITLTNELPTITIIVIQNENKYLGIVVPKVVDIEMHDLQEMQYPSEDLFSSNILPFLKGYLVRSSSPVLDTNSLIEDSQLQIYAPI